MSPVVSTQSMIVARFIDGRQIKGVTHDFAPGKQEFHVFDKGDETSKAISVSLRDLKALFFVRSYEGDRRHREYKLFDRVKIKARKVLIRFRDGEVLVGLTVGYSPDKPGFFVTPADPDSNNLRIYVLNQAVEKIHWI